LRSRVNRRKYLTNTVVPITMAPTPGLYQVLLPHREAQEEEGKEEETTIT
jgi:hypothetical protein